MTGVTALAGTNGSTGTTGTSGTTGNTGGTTSTAPNDQMGKDTFLKLLVAQLQYQDPSSPTDSTQFMAQTAAFTQVEKLDSLLTTQQNAAATAAKQTATSMVGRTITYTDSSGTAATGVVKSASFSGSEPTLRVGDTDVPLSSVTEVTSSAG